MDIIMKAALDDAIIAANSDISPEKIEALQDHLLAELEKRGLTITRIEDEEVARVRELVRSHAYRSRGGEDG